MNLNYLQYFLNQNNVPQVKKSPKTFLGISKQPHYENVISNIYAFFFSVSEVHGMQDLFITSLLELIKETNLGETKSIDDLTDFEIETEFSTKKGGRIDLLLLNNNWAIIIENKVYHKLNNDLEDYWTSIKTPNESNKIGIVISLYRLKTGHPQFINITHLELMKRVMDNLELYKSTAKEKYLVFLKDLNQNILNLTKSQMETEDLEFYFNNQPKIIDLKNLHFAVRDHIVNQIEVACRNLFNNLVFQTPKGDNENRLRYFVSKNNSNLMFTILFENLLNSKKEIEIIIELKNDLLKDKEQFRSIEFSDFEKEILISDFYTNTNNSWAHFAKKTYSISESTTVTNLGEFIVDKIESDGFKAVFVKLDNFLKEK